MYASDPVPGVWTLVLDFTAPVPGNELSDPFSGQIRLNALRFSRGGLPGSPAVTLQRGKAVTYQISVHNTGLAPENVFLDPRLTALRSYRLQPQDRVAGLALPLPASGSPPEWIVPTMTRAVSVISASPVPVTFDFGPFPGEQDQAAARGKRVTAAYPLGKALTPVTQGLWYAVPAEAGPFTDAGAVASTVEFLDERGDAAIRHRGEPVNRRLLAVRRRAARHERRPTTCSSSTRGRHGRSA